jgi:uncharacterized protein
VDLQASDSPGGAIIAVRAIPKAGRSAIAGLRDGMLLVRLQSAPADGAANAELLGLLSRALRVPRRDLEIVSGESSRTKRVRVSGLRADAVVERLSSDLSS